MKDFSFAVFPLERLRSVRATHRVSYVNNRCFDYAFQHARVIPWCLEHWTENGLHLDDEIVGLVWQSLSYKRDGGKDGELRRAGKLVLDAFRGLWDIAATAQFSGLDVRYNSSADMNGLDIQLMTKPNPVWVQFSVSASGKGNTYAMTKQRRRIDRNVIHTDVVRLEANIDELDRRHQPWVPNDDWYRQVYPKVRQCLTSTQGLGLDPRPNIDHNVPMFQTFTLFDDLEGSYEQPTRRPLQDFEEPF